MAAAKIPGETIIKFASANYQVQDLCFFLEDLGVKIEGIGTTTLKIQGVKEINKDITYYLAEDPIDSDVFHRHFGSYEFRDRNTKMPDRFFGNRITEAPKNGI